MFRSNSHSNRRSLSLTPRDDMYVRYFRELAGNIVMRAEMIAIERRLMNIQEKLTVNKADLLDRLAFVKINSSDIQRDVSCVMLFGAMDMLLLLLLVGLRFGCVAITC